MPSRGQAHRPGKKLGLSYYHKPADRLAQDLLGKVLVRRVEDLERRVRIVETEAYAGPQDLACHSSKGLTPRTSVMFGPAGHAYVYLIYGMYQMLNITCGEGQAVLLRAAEPLDGWDADLSGPGRLARALEITRADNAIPLTGQALYLLDSGDPPARIVRGPRIGVNYAQHWKDALLRFCDADSSAVSKPR
jgi:DNA-3-methyladenine glycosylase